MKKLFFLGACLMALGSSPVMAQTPEGDVVVVRVLDGIAGKSKLVVVRAEGKSETTELDSGLNEKSMTATGEVFRRVIAQLYREGYSLKSTFTGSQGFVSTLIFVKEK
jgi:hypothetical protein